VYPTPLTFKTRGLAFFLTLQTMLKLYEISFIGLKMISIGI